MKGKLKNKGIKVKDTKDGTDFIVEFNVITDSFDEAVQIRKRVQQELQLLLDGQTTLED